MTNFARLATANTYDNALRNLAQRQSALSNLQENLTSGKRVVRASDDPTAAAQAERALTRIERVKVEQRALEVQRNAIATAESTLGDAIDALQRIRELTVQAGSAANNSTDLASIAQEIQSLRDAMLGYANRRDTNGLPLFGGLGSTEQPFQESASGVTFDGLSGQRRGDDVTLPFVLDGQATWMDVPTGNTQFDVDLAAANTGDVWTDVGLVTDPSLLTGDDYSITFTVTPGPTPGSEVVTYTVARVPAAAPALPTNVPYQPGQPISFEGLQFKANGAPDNGDVVSITPSQRGSSATAPDGTVFGVLDRLIAELSAGQRSNQRTQTVNRGLVELDTALERLQRARSFAGDLLGKADRINDNQDGRAIQLEADRSRAEDLDVIQGISDFQNQQTGYQAALQSYAQVQRLSLFDYLR
jgi:flagellar hook-associated protein 3 FlgL